VARGILEYGLKERKPNYATLAFRNTPEKED
jgi:hypothetical protein